MVFGWIIRAKDIYKNVCEERSLNDLRDYKIFIIKLVQNEIFSEEIHCIKLHKNVPKAQLKNFHLHLTIMVF